MARINNKGEYPDDLVITGRESLIGSDIDGETENYPIDLIKDYISQNTDNIEVNNIIQPFYTIIAEGDTILDAVEAVNNSAMFTITGNQVVYFRIPRVKEGENVGGGGSNIATPNTNTLIFDYYWLQRSGKGTYGIGGSKTVNVSNLLLFKTSEAYSLPPSENGLPPRVIRLVTDNINTPPENILNNYPTNFTITNDEDVYFEIREVETEGVSGTPPVYTGEMKVYRFVGDAGIYGLTGDDDAVSSDFVAYSINNTGVTRNDFLSLIDVEDTTYSGKLGYAPIVSIDNAGSIEPKLKLKKIPQFEDIFSGSTVLVGGVTHITGLTYRVWATSYIINNVHYGLPVSKTVTLEDGGVDPRFDVFAIRYEPTSSITAPEIVVIEGTPSSTPVKPTVDLSKEVEVSFKLLLAGETSDPNVNIELVFNENTGESTEWNNIFLLSGGDLTDTDDPYIGSSCFSVSQSSIDSAIDKRVSWKNNSDINFSGSKELTFALKTDSSWTKYSNLSIKLIDSNSSKYRILNLNPSIISKYGFDHTESGWRLLSIKLSDFIALDLSQTTFDTIEFTLNKLPDVSIDWINFQGGLPETNDKKPVTEIESGDNIDLEKTGGKVIISTESKLISVLGGTGVIIDNTDPRKPVINSLAASKPVLSVNGDKVDNTDPQNPVVENELTNNESDAVKGANSPSGSNVFATMDDIIDSVDSSLYLIGGVLGLNVGQTTERFTWSSGTQEFILTNIPTNINYISVNGQLLSNEEKQWSVDMVNKKVTILDTLDSGDTININYQFLINT